MGTPYREADPLGLLISEHAVTRAQQGIRLAVGLFCTAVALDCVAVPTLAWDKSRPVEVMDVAIFGIATLIFSALAISTFSHFLQSRRERVEVREGGLRIRGGKQAREIRWADMAAVGGLFWQSAPKTTPYLSPLWVDDASGERYRLPTHLVEPYALGQELQSRTFEQRLKAVEETLAAGKVAHFGRIALDENRVVVGEEAPIPRAELRRITLTSRWIEMLGARGKRRLVPSDEVPNLDILLAVLSPNSHRSAMPSSSSA